MSPTPLEKPDKISRSNLRKTLATAIIITSAIGALLFYLTRIYVINQAERKIQDLLLAQKGIHHYVQEVMLPALYSYKDQGAVSRDFYAPELFSSSFITRNQHVFYNKERVEAGLPELYYKLAANNPRNPVNKADAMEEKLVRMFNNNREIKKFRDIITLDEKKYLYVALPFLENQKQCLVCHGKPENAPKQLQERYKGAGGYNETIGYIRAIISIRAPLEREYFNTYIIATALLSGAAAIVSLFFFSAQLKGLVKKRTLTLEKEITDRQRAEEEVKIINAELKSKNEELEQIVYVASHDLRSPLVNIDGYGRELGYAIEDIRSILAGKSLETALTAVTPVLDDDISEALRFIRTSTAKMDMLLGGLLRLSRSGRAALKIESVDMNQIISNVVASTEFQIKENGVEVIVDDLPQCQSDAVQMGQVFSNLLDNALKCLDSNRPGMVRISGEVVDGQSVYCVEDNGIGIDVNHIDKIFEIFQQLDPAQNKGEGLGLTIVKRILARLGGSIRVESKIGLGSCFYISMPKENV